MSAKSKIVYPYPVYFPNTEDYENYLFDIGCNVDQSETEVTFHFCVEIYDEEILDLIKKNRAGIFCRLNCPMTKYRGFFEVTCDESGRFHKSFSSGDLIGKTKVICFIVTKEKIVNFFDKNFIGFYKNECVDFPEYAIIGCSSEETRHIYKFKYLTDTIPSICTIAEKKDIKEVSYDLSCESKIYIYLPPDEYSKYINLKGQLVRTKQALLFLNTLTTIIEKIKTGQGEDFISSEWYPVIESALFNIGVKEFTEDGMPESSYVYAQRILNNPIKDTFTEISSFVKDED